MGSYLMHLIIFLVELIINMIDIAHVHLYSLRVFCLWI